MYKFLLSATVALSFSLPAFAEDAAKVGENFEKNKTEMLENIDKKIKAIQDHRSCVSGAKDRAAIKECMQKMRGVRMDFREDHMASRQEHMQERMKKMEERKKEMMEKRQQKDSAPATTN